MALGEGQSSMKLPIRPRTTRFMVDLQGSSVDKATMGISTLFMNFYCCSLAGCLFHDATSFLNAVISGGSGGVDSRPPPGAMALGKLARQSAGS